MNTTEKLTKIRAKCVALLETAKQRTPGKWRVESSYIGNGSAGCISAGLNSYGDGPAAYPIGRLAENELKEPDSAFITACAGPAEAGWRATIAAIEICFRLEDVRYGWDGDCGASAHAESLADQIIAAWENQIIP
jgi:hypothetical protein